MAVSSKESSANIQNLLGQGVTQDFLNTQDYGPKLNQQEASRILDAFRASNAYSASNIINATSGTPNQTTDLIGLRDALRNEYQVPTLESQYQTGIEGLVTLPGQLNEQLGINTAQSEYDAAINAMRQASTGVVNDISKTEDMPVVLNKIRGIQAQIQAQGERKVNTITTAAQALGDKLNALRSQASEKVTQEKNRLEALFNRIQSAKQEVEAQYGIRESEIKEKRQLVLQYPNAGIKLTDSYDAIAGKLQKANDAEEIKQLRLQYPSAKIKKNASFDDAIKSIRKSLDNAEGKKLFAQTFGYMPKSYGSKEKKMLKKYFDEEYSYVKEKRALELADIKSAISNRGSGGSSSKQDKEWQSYVDKMETAVRKGERTREEARDSLRSRFPEYDENVIYEILPDNFTTIKK